MDSTYSKAFDHLSVDQIHFTKGAFSEPKVGGVYWSNQILTTYSAVIKFRQ